MSSAQPAEESRPSSERAELAAGIERTRTDLADHGYLVHRKNGEDDI
jgi:hypothetical protein